MADPEDKSQVGASIPGAVSKINVKVGDTVEKNQTLVTIEAMNQSSELGKYRTVTIFPDVKPVYWASAYINLAAKGKQIISGYPDGKFYPARTVTCGQAVSILVRLLGYTADEVGGIFPDSYMLEAKEEILKSRSEYEKEVKERRAELQRQENRLQQKEETIDRKTEAIEKKEELLSQKHSTLDKETEEIRTIKRGQMEQLERISGLTADEAKKYLISQVENEVTHETALKIKEVESRMLSCLLLSAVIIGINWLLLRRAIIRAPR